MTTALPATIDLAREPIGDRWCFGCRKRLAHTAFLRDHADPARRSPYLGPWWETECSGCGRDRTHFPGRGPL